MKKYYATIHVWLHDMDHNIDLIYRRKIRPVSCLLTTNKSMHFATMETYHNWVKSCLKVACNFAKKIKIVTNTSNNMAKET